MSPCGTVLPVHPHHAAEALRAEAVRAGHAVAPLDAAGPGCRQVRVHVRPPRHGRPGGHGGRQVVATVAAHPDGSVLTVSPARPDVTEVWAEADLARVQDLVGRVRRRWR